MDIQTIWRLIGWLAEWCIPTTIVVFVLKRVAKALTNRITTVVDAYAGERSKLLAQFHNLDKLVEQTARLTETTKLIESRISYDLWDRQMKWNAKRDSYIKLMETLGERYHVEERNKLLEQIRRREQGRVNDLWISERDKALLRWQEVQSRLTQAACVAPLVVSEEAHDILIQTSAALQNVNYNDPAFEQTADANLRVLQGALDMLLLAAKKDLGTDHIAVAQR